MVDKIQKIRKEVERKLDVMRYQVHRLDAYKELKSILDYMDSLREEPVSEDLEEEKTRLFGDCKVRKGAFELGAKWKEQQMMKNSVECTVHADASGYPYIGNIELYDYENDKPLAKAGDKVKVIINN